jgi:hypothetical protein
VLYDVTRQEDNIYDLRLQDDDGNSGDRLHTSENDHPQKREDLDFGYRGLTCY